VRDTRRCSCGYTFTGSEPDAEPSVEDRERQGGALPEQRVPADSALPGTLIRVAVLVVLFVVAQLAIPHFVRPDDMRGGV
jgi:hypothetical protein